MENWFRSNTTGTYQMKTRSNILSITEIIDDLEKNVVGLREVDFTDDHKPIATLWSREIFPQNKGNFGQIFLTQNILTNINKVGYLPAWLHISQKKNQKWTNIL